jgi:hypothetical protein
MVINDRFARTIMGRDHGFIRPQSTVFASPDPEGVGSASSDPKIGRSVSLNPEDVRQPLGEGASCMGPPHNPQPLRI